MTYFVSFRSQSVGGSVTSATVWSGDGTISPLSLRPVENNMLGALVAGKNILFATHGFNVSREAGACSLTQLDQFLDLASSDIFFGVLWPGDFWLPVLNYPFEGGVSMHCGRLLADFCNRNLAAAQSLSFVSHSLGARLVLEAVKNLNRQAQSVCSTAAAINQDCLMTEYAAAAGKAKSISLLASRRDMVLGLAFPIGDPIADFFNEDHKPFEPALGYAGPPLPTAPPVVAPWQIAKDADYGHGNYLPPGDSVTPKPAIPAEKWSAVAAFMARAFRGQPQSWPS